MKTLPLLLAAIINVALPASPIFAQTAPVASASADIPLVVIRFNQRKVYFEQQLYNAVSRAVAIKPTVLLEVVSFVPTGTSNRSVTEDMAKRNLSNVIQTLTKMGVPRERINVVNERSAALRYHEVHIYVQ